MPSNDLISTLGTFSSWEIASLVEVDAASKQVREESKDLTKSSTILVQFTAQKSTQLSAAMSLAEVQGHKQSAFTKLRSTLSRHIALNDIPKVKLYIDKLKVAFAMYEAAHENLLESLGDDQSAFMFYVIHVYN